MIRPRSSRAGFTLAEVAVTIVIVGTMLVFLLQGLNSTKMLAAHTRNSKLARELALLKLGQIGSGLFQEDIDRGITGTFAEEGYPDFTYEVVVGDEAFLEEQLDDRGQQRAFDSWAPRDTRETESSTEEEEEEVEEPFEKVKIKITFPKLKEFKNELILEQWFPWAQVYGESEESTEGTANSASSGASGSSNSNSSSKP